MCVLGNRGLIRVKRAGRGPSESGHPRVTCTLSDMYRVFESLDEMVQTVEQAYGVPMTSNCVVPRTLMLELLDDLRNALPEELDDAQDVLDKQDEILAGAEDRARELVDNAEAQARETIESSTSEANDILDDASRRATATVASADDEAQRRLDSAAAEADRLVAEGNDAYQRYIDEGVAEQQRLVADSEVMRRAEEEAHRLVDSAHVESDRLRTDADQFVDGKLAEFEESLSAILRTVTRDRAALRRGAGVGGNGHAAEAPQQYRQSEYRSRRPRTDR